MKVLKSICYVALCLFIITGCGNKSEKEMGEAQEQTQESMKKTQAEFEKNKKEFVVREQARLDSLEKALNEIGKDIQEQTSGATQRKMQQTWSDLKKQIETIRTNVGNLEDASEKRWQRLKSTASDQLAYLEEQITKLGDELES